MSRVLGHRTGRCRGPPQRIGGCGSQLRVQGGMKGPVQGAARVIMGLALGGAGHVMQSGGVITGGTIGGHLAWGAQQGTVRG